MSSVEDLSIWGSYQTAIGGKVIFIAVVGRPAFSESEWRDAASLNGQGGLVSKAIFKGYVSEGVQFFDRLNGHFVAFVYDERADILHMVTDRFGMCLAYGNRSVPQVFSSHPDILAAASDGSNRFDKTSLAEFLITGRISYPFTYYSDVQALETASIYTFRLHGHSKAPENRKFFQLKFCISERTSEEDLAKELAVAFKRAVQRRSLPLFGPLAIGLSGGLDSRAVLSCAEVGTHVRPFTILDHENEETAVARAVAHACGTELTTFHRSPEYYSQWAALGARISGATGCLRSNHYLGIQPQLRKFGIKNFLTGCYCDYLFKGLSLNTVESPLLRVQKLATFNFSYYLPHFWPKTELAESVRNRLRQSFPYEARNLSTEDWVHIEARRVFPLAYEGDSAMRLVPMRVMPWYIPVTDNDLMSVYQQIPSLSKLNSELFRRMLQHICSPEILAIKDNNTGTHCDAGIFSRVVHRYRTALRNRADRYLRKNIANSGSWPSWEYYFHHSPEIAGVWIKSNPAAEALFTEICGENPLHRPLTSFPGPAIPWLGRLWTLKTWLENRCGSTRPEPPNFD